MSAQTPEKLATALSSVTREIEQYAHAHGWDQPVQVFALVDTEQLLSEEPGLSEQVDPESTLTPIAQESLPSEDLGEALARIGWPEQVLGCAVVQEIVVLPPEAEQSLPGEDDAAQEAAAAHPDRREARLVAAVLRQGSETCVLRLRPEPADQPSPTDTAEDAGAQDEATQDESARDESARDESTQSPEGEVMQDASLAPNLLHALHETFTE